MPEVVTLGETMVMFSPENSGPLRYVNNFRKRIAGSESNVAIGLCRLGHSCGWISKVGQDEFGRFIIKEIRGEGVDTSFVKVDDSAFTGIMFKEILEGRETKVYYYRKGSAASKMTMEELDEKYIGSAKLLHITGITPGLSDSCLETVIKAIDIAKANNVTISFDPNIRLKIWNRKRTTEVLKNFLPKVDILMPGLDESEIILGFDEPDKIIDSYLSYGIKTIALKMGVQGTIVASEKDRVRVDVYKDIKIVDPIGAGDAFAAGFLTGILEERSLTECGKLANAMGAFALTTVGDIEGLPLRSELDTFIGNKREITR